MWNDIRISHLTSFKTYFALPEKTKSLKKKYFSNDIFFTLEEERKKERKAERRRGRRGLNKNNNEKNYINRRVNIFRLDRNDKNFIELIN